MLCLRLKLSETLPLELGGFPFLVTEGTDGALEGGGLQATGGGLDIHC